MRGKCKFQMALYSCKIDDVEKMFWGDREAHVLKKLLLEHINEIPSPGEMQLICYAIVTSPTFYCKHSQTKILKKYQYEERYKPLKLQMCIETIGKYIFHMDCNC